MKQLLLLLLVCFSLPLSAQEPNQNLIMACKPGGYSLEEIRAFALNPVGRLNLNYREDMVDIINTGREKCGCDGVLDVRHVNYIMDSSYIADNVELFDFENSGADGTEILYRTVAHYVGKIVIYRDRSCPNECLIPFIKDTCGNLIKAKLIKPLEQEVPAFARQGTTSAGGQDPSNSGNEKPEKKDTLWIPEAGPIVTSSGKKPTSWQEQEYERQQKEKQGTTTDSLKMTVGQSGITNNYYGDVYSNSFNNSLNGSKTTQPEEIQGEYVYSRRARGYILVSPDQEALYRSPYFYGRQTSSYGVSFGGSYGGNYYPPAQCYNGVTGLTSSSSYPVNFNAGGRQYRKGMNGQFEAGSIGSATGPSSGYGLRSF